MIDSNVDAIMLAYAVRQQQLGDRHRIRGVRAAGTQRKVLIAGYDNIDANKPFNRRVPPIQEIGAAAVI